MVGAIERSTVQIHLNRRCNLACLHCYSRSGPREREQLDPAVLARFLEDAWREGYRVAAFSGGEPFLYRGFADTLRTARALGFITIAVTNATTLRAGEPALGLLDLLAISVDGPEPVHNAIRRSATAFARMRRGLGVVRESGVAFGIAHTVTRESLPHLAWLARFAREAGARSLQLHPLAMVGAAADTALPALDGEGLARTWLAAMALRAEHGDALAIHVDVFNRERIRADPGLVVPMPVGAGGRPPLAAVLNPLVLMANGDASPICHAMAPGLRLGNVAQARLGSLVDRFLQDGLPGLRALAEALRDDVLADDDGWPCLDWYERLERGSYRQPVTPPEKSISPL